MDPYNLVITWKVFNKISCYRWKISTKGISSGYGITNKIVINIHGGYVTGIIPIICNSFDYVPSSFTFIGAF